MSAPFTALHLDESGDFHRAPLHGPRGLVLGGLACRYSPNAARLKEHIQAALPGVPWPPHGAHCRYPLYRPAALLADPGLARSAPEPVREAAELLREGPDFASVRATVRAKSAWKLDLDVLYDADQQLKGSHPDLERALVRVVREQERALDDLLGALGKEGAFVLAAVGARELGPDAVRRWEALWYALLRRMRALTAPAELRVIMVPPHFWSGSSEAPALGGGPGVDIARPQDFGPQAHPLYVLADHVVGRLNRHVEAGPRDWDALEREWTARGLPPLSHGGRPALTLAGSLEHRIDDVAHGRVSDEVFDGLDLPPWSVDQARRIARRQP